MATLRARRTGMDRTERILKRRDRGERRGSVQQTLCELGVQPFLRSPLPLRSRRTGVDRTERILKRRDRRRTLGRPFNRLCVLGDLGV
jgi:hypothetical protein